MRKPAFCICKNKVADQLRELITAKLISAFLFATRTVQSLYFLYTKFQASSHLPWLYSPVYVGLKLRELITAKLISAFLFATRTVQSLYFLYTKFQASSHLPWLYSPVYVGLGRKPQRLVFSQGSKITTLLI